MTRLLRLSLSLFFLFLSYYLIKPLRTSQFLREFPPQALPALYLVVSLLSWFLTRTFQAAANRYSRTVLVGGTFLFTIAMQMVFAWVIPLGGHLTTAAFYLWASIYFLLLVSTFWGCINERFSPQEAQRSFAGIALGATLGNIAGAFLADILALYNWRAGCLIWSSLALGISLLLLLPELRYPLVEPGGAARAEGGWVGHPALRAVAFMVVALAVFSTTLDFLTQKRLDDQLGRETYQQVMGQRWPDGYEQFRALRPQLAAQRDWHKLSELSGLPPAELKRGFEDYRDRLENQVRGLYARIFWIQGLCGFFTLSVVCRPLVRRFGLRRSLLLLPGVILLILPLLALPLEVVVIQFLLVLIGTLNYSLNNPLKEMLYSHCDSRSLLQAKPIIEGPCMRLGDVLCALFSLGLVVFAWPSELTLLPVAALVLLWWRSMSRLQLTEAGCIVDAHQSDADDLGNHGQFPGTSERRGQGGDAMKPDHEGL